MGKIQQFKNKPSPYSYGQYYYENDDMENLQLIEESDSIKKPVDKYSDKSLHSYVVSDETRDYIIERKLRFVGISGIQVNNLTVKENSTSNTHIDTDFRGYICDRNTFDCFDNNGDIRAYSSLNEFFRVTSENTDLKETAQFFRLQPGNISNNSAPDFSFLEDKNIIKNLSPDLANGLQLQDGDYLTPEQRDIRFGIQNMIEEGATLWDSAQPKSDFIPFKPNDDIFEPEQRLTSIFSENGGENYIQIVIWLKSNNGNGRSRRRRFYVLKISPNDILNTTTSPATPGELSNTPIVVSHGDGISVREGHESRSNSDCDKPAWYISNFSIIFNLEAGVSADDFPNVDDNILGEVEPRNPITENNLDLDFTSVNLFQESFTSATGNALWRKNFTPFSQITIYNRLDKNLQGFKTNDIDRQICSAPSTVRLKVNIAQYDTSENISFIENAFPTSVSPHYKVCILHWDDVDDEFETVQDVFDKKPTNFEEILIAQDNNTFIFKDYSENFINSYTTPGIKKIKILVFNYVPYKNDSWNNDYKNSELPPFNKIEPMRYKVLTSRIFLDIPINEFEDFGELGGSEYRTLPWPYTSPIIGGVSENSKYTKSVNDILGGGKIGNQDLIDETFLTDAKENDELGKNIEKMDLEQIRYFDKNYNMNTLLGLSDEDMLSGLMPNPAYLESDYLEQLPFPTYFEEFDVTGRESILNNLNDVFQSENYGNGDDDLFYVYVNANASPTINYMVSFQYGAIKLNIEDTGNGPGDIQIYTRGAGITEVFTDTLYRVKFSAKSSINRNFEFHALKGGEPWTRFYESGVVQLTTEMQDFEFTFYPEQYEELASFRIFLGEQADYGTHLVEVRNFSVTTLTDAAETLQSSDIDIWENEYARPDIANQVSEYSNQIQDFYASPMTDDVLLGQIYLRHQAGGYIWAHYWAGELGGALNWLDAGTDTPTTWWGLELGQLEQDDSQNTATEMGLNDNSEITPFQSCNFFFSHLLDDDQQMIPVLREDIGWDAGTTYSAYDCTTKRYNVTRFPFLKYLKQIDVDMDALEDLEIYKNTLYFDNLTSTFDPYFSEKWDGNSTETSFSEESSVGQIFITDNIDSDLIDNCKLELNTGNLTDKSIYDSSGNGNKGLLIGDYKIKKPRKGERMRRDSFIKVAKKTSNENGAL